METQIIKLKNWGLLALLVALTALPFAPIANAQTVTVNPSSTTDLVKVSGGQTVFAIAPNNTQRPFTSANIFFSYGFSFSQVGTVAQTLLNRFPRTQVIKTANDPTVYRLNNDFTKQPFATAEAFTSAGFQFNEVVTVNQTELNSYPTGSIIGGTGTTTSTTTPTRLSGFEQAVNNISSSGTSTIQSFLASTVSVAQLGSAFTSESASTAAQTIFNQIQGTGNFNFSQDQPEIPKLKSANSTLQNFTIGLTGRTGTNNSEKRMFAYHVNSSNQVDQVIFASNICSVSGVTCQ